MGTWGTGPFESDQASEWFEERIQKPIARTLRRGTDHSELYAAVSMAADYSEIIGDEVRDEAIGRADELIGLAPDMGWRTRRLEREYVSKLEHMRERLVRPKKR